MAKKFRKVYIVVEDNKVFGVSNYMSMPMYRDKSDADRMCKIAEQKAVEESKMYYMTNKPKPKFKVHTFYLVHEDLF